MNIFKCNCGSDSFKYDYEGQRLICTRGYCGRVHTIEEAAMICQLDPSTVDVFEKGSWIIMKRSREKDNPVAADAYNGISCDMVGIEGGQVYTNKVMAYRDAQLLTRYNPVGFVVLRINDEGV